MEIKQQNNLEFLGVDIVKIDFTAIKPFDQISQINLDIKPKVYHLKGEDGGFRIVMEIFVHATDFFSLALVAIGTFKFDSGFSADQRKSVINQNAPAIMFPYVRSFISLMTLNMGMVVGALMLPPQTFAGELEVVEEPV